MRIRSRAAANFMNPAEWNLSPYQILTLGFALTILVGAFLLMLPESSQEGKSLPFIDALFTATSATCVTGLTVVDTGNYFSTFGKMVLILLVQIGGLGVMTLTTLFAVMMGRRIQLKDRLLVQESLNQLTMKGMVRLVFYVVKITFLIEFIGGTILAIRFVPQYGMEGLFYGYWHAVSGFCNAGFDIFGGTNFFQYAADPVVVLTISMLIILGGLGFAVMNDIWGQRTWSGLTAQSKIVILTTLVLLVFGTAILFLLEKDNTGTIGGLGIGGKLLASWFESVTARTAGFAMFDNGLLTESSLLMLILLMFIGASPASTGGGIKTSTFAIIVASIWSLIRGREDVVLFSRTVSVDVILRSLAIFFLAASVTFFAAAYLCLTEGIPVIKAGFEVVSAFATVGLSTGITAELSSDGKFLLIVMMLMGRVGIITFAMAFARKRNNRRLCRHPEGKFVIG